jgi:hypothetical protein
MSFGILNYPDPIPGILIENPGGVVKLRGEEAGESFTSRLLREDL